MTKARLLVRTVANLSCAQSNCGFACTHGKWGGRLRDTEYIQYWPLRFNHPSLFMNCGFLFQRCMDSL